MWGKRGAAIAVLFLMFLTVGTSVGGSALNEQEDQVRTTVEQTADGDITQHGGLNRGNASVVFLDESYIVQLDGMSIARRTANITQRLRQERQNLKRHHRQNRKDNQIRRIQELEDRRERLLQRQHEKLSQIHDRFRAGVDNISERHTGIGIGNGYRMAFNGIALHNVSAKELDRIRERPEVENIVRNRVYTVDLDDSVSVIGADSVHNRIWNGTNVTGKDIEVAVIDTGVNYSHPDLGGCSFAETNNSDPDDCRFLPGYDFYNNDRDPMDDNGHGTHVAGIVGANGSITGVAPDVKYRGYKVCGSFGSCSLSAIIDGIERAADPNDDGDPADRVDILQMSLGGPGWPTDPHSIAINNVFQQGVLPVISAGNEGSRIETVGAPAAARHALAVGATNDWDELVQFSSRGPEKNASGTMIFLKPEVSAPGYNIKSTWLDGGYDRLSGTSMASPHVSGVAALARQTYPGIAPGVLKALLVQTATPFDTGSRDEPVEMWETGSGRVNASAAVSTASAATPATVNFGLVSTSGTWWNRSRAINIHNIGSGLRNYSLATDLSASGLSVAFNTTQVTVEAGGQKPVQVNVSVDRTVLADDRYAGYINVSSNTSGLLRQPLFFVKDDFDITVTPNRSRHGVFNVHATSPIELPDLPLHVQHPDGTWETTTLTDIWFTQERVPEDQDWETVLELDTAGTYTLLVNSSRLPTLNASTTVTVDRTPPDITVDAAADGTTITFNASSPADLAPTPGRPVPLVSDSNIWNPQMFPSGQSTYVFWGKRGWSPSVALQVSRLDGRLQDVTQLNGEDINQVRDARFTAVEDGVLGVWNGDFSDHCDPGYCTAVRGRWINLTSEAVDPLVNVSGFIPNASISFIDTAVMDNQKVMVGWRDNRLNTDAFYYKNQSAFITMYNLSAQNTSAPLNVTVGGFHGIFRGPELVPADDGMDIYLRAVENKSTDSVYDEDTAVYRSHLYPNGTMTALQRLTPERDGTRFDATYWNGTPVLFWHDDPGGSGESDLRFTRRLQNGSWWTTTVDRIGNGRANRFSLDTAERGTLHLLYSHGTNDAVNITFRTYNGTWSDRELVSESERGAIVESPTRIGAAIEQKVVGFWRGSSSYKPFHYHSLVPRPRFGGTQDPWNLTQPLAPRYRYSVTAASDVWNVVIGDKRRVGYYGMLGFSSPDFTVKQVTRPPAATITLPSGATNETRLTRSGTLWQGDIPSDEGGTHIIRVRGKDRAFNTGVAAQNVTNNISAPGNTRPPAPTWHGPIGEINDTTPLLNWSAVTDPDSDPVRYIILLDNSSDMSSPDVAQNVETTQYTVQEPLPFNETYHVTVRANDQKADGVVTRDAFNMTDITPPQLEQFQVSVPRLYSGQANDITVSLFDRGGLDSVTLATNETGQWANKTANYSSPATVAGNSDTATFSWDNRSTAANTTVGVRVWMEDIYGNVDVSETRTFRVIPFDPVFDTDPVVGTPFTVEGALPFQIAVNRSDLNWSYTFNTTQEPRLTSITVNESFEEEPNYSRNNWSTQGDAPWNLSAYPFEGSQSIRAGDINDSQHSNLTFTYTPEERSVVSFWYRVSSERGYDFFRFSINEDTVLEESGDTDWKRTRFMLDADQAYSLTWTYDKDFTISHYDDTVYVDRLQIGPGESVSTGTFTPRNAGNYTVNTSVNESGEILASEERLVAVNASPEIFTTGTLPSYPLTGRNHTLPVQYRASLPANLAVNVTNSTGRVALFNQSVLNMFWSTTDTVTGEPYNDSLTRRINVSLNRSGRYNLTWTVAAGDQSTSQQTGATFFAPRNLTFNVTTPAGELAKRVVLLSFNTLPVDRIFLTTNNTSIIVPDITAFGERYGFGLWHDTATIENAILFNATDLTTGANMTTRLRNTTQVVGDTVLHMREGIHHNRSYNRTLVDIDVDFADINADVRDPMNTTLFACGTYSIVDDACNGSWYIPEDERSAWRTNSSASLTYATNRSVEAFGLGEQEYCGNDYCSADETHDTCSADCAAPADDDEEDDDDDIYNFTPSSSPEPVYTGPVLNLSEHHINISDIRTDADTPLSFDVADNTSLPIQNITLLTTENQDDITVTVDHLPQSAAPTLPPTVVGYRFMDISVDAREDVSLTMTLRFTVDRSWVQQPTIRDDAIALYHHDDNWTALETRHVRTEDSKDVYTADITGFSTFGIASEEPECAQNAAAAVDPGEESCSAFENACIVPDGWTEVESCERWEQKQTAKELLETVEENVSDPDPETRDLLDTAREEYEQGNYSGAIDLVETARTAEAEQGEDETQFLPFSLHTLLYGFMATVVVIVFVIGGAVIYRVRKQDNEAAVLQELEELTEVLVQAADQGRIADPNAVMDDLEVAKNAASRGDYDIAVSRLKRVEQHLDTGQQQNTQRSQGVPDFNTRW